MSLRRALAVLCLAWVGCGPPPVASMGTIPALLPAAPATPGPDYLIQAGDQLDIRFPFAGGLNEALPVRPDGRISLSVTGEIAVVGMTPTALEQKISTLAGAHLRDPQVTVVVTRPGMQYVYVGGEVARPGAVVLVPRMTLLEAVVNSGGFRETARRDSVLLIVPTGKSFATERVNLQSVVDAKALERVTLQPNDVIYVPKSWIGDMDDVVSLYVAGLIPGLPSVGVGYSIAP